MPDTEDAAHYAPDYATARQQFLKAATAAGAALESLPHPQRGPDGGELAIDLAWLVDSRSYFATELEAMRDLRDKGLVTLDDAGVQVTPMGWFFVRAVAMVFDRYLQSDRNRARFSKII